jgi:hypothetical protein
MRKLNSADEVNLSPWPKRIEHDGLLISYAENSQKKLEEGIVPIVDR